MPMFFIHHPGLSRRLIARVCEEAVARATREQYLRHNAVDSVTGKNSGNNVGKGFPAVYCEEWDDPAIGVALMLKGGGSENVGSQYSLPDDSLDAGRDLEGVRRVVLDAVRRAEGKGCPPGDPRDLHRRATGVPGTSIPSTSSCAPSATSIPILPWRSWRRGSSGRPTHWGSVPSGSGGRRPCWGSRSAPSTASPPVSSSP